MSASRFTNTVTVANSTARPWITGRSRAETASINVVPSPGITKMASTTTTPPINQSVVLANCCTAGTTAFGSAGLLIDQLFGRRPALDPAPYLPLRALA